MVVGCQLFVIALNPINVKIFMKMYICTYFNRYIICWFILKGKWWGGEGGLDSFILETL